jgi:hypothetical protein
LAGVIGTSPATFIDISGIFLSRKALVLGVSAGLLSLSGCGKNAPTRASTTAASHGAGAKSTPASTPPGSATTSGADHVVLPATFTAEPGGKLSPATVSGPGSIPVLLTVVSGDGRAHQVIVRVPPRPRTLHVPAAGRASLRLENLPVGSFAIVLDGAVRGRLITGVNPGP